MPRRRPYPKHKGDAFDVFISERSMDSDGLFSFAKMVELFDALDCADFIPADGNNGTKRMTAGILLRSRFANGVIEFRDGTIVRLDVEEP